MSKRLPRDEELKSIRAANEFKLRNQGVNEKMVAVEKNDIIINDRFQVYVENKGTYQNVLIYWEEGGYTNFRDYGLFGSYGTSFYRMSYNSGTLTIYGDGYIIAITD